METREKGPWSWLTGGQGWTGIAQFPNPAIIVWLAAVVTGWAGLWNGTARASAIEWIGHGALMVWALDELVRGTSPFRRVMGAIVLAVQLWRLFA